jgi:emfourin
VKINLEKSGGIMGSTSSQTIDTDKLSKSKAAEVKELLSNSDFFKLSSLRSSPAVQKGAADYFTYDITVEDEGKKYSVKCSDVAMTKELRDLISSLSKVKVKK